jgi:hypothetical protein
MSFITRKSFRAITRTTPRVRVSTRSRTFVTIGEANAKYVAEEKALQHHAAGKYNDLLFDLLLNHSAEASDLWRKIRCVMTSHRQTMALTSIACSFYVCIPAGGYTRLVSLSLFSNSDLSRRLCCLGVQH